MEGLQDQASRRPGKGKTSTDQEVHGQGQGLRQEADAHLRPATKGGKVKVTVDGKATTLSLYDKAGKALKKSWAFKGAVKAHKVVVTVLGKKVTAEQGHRRPTWPLLKVKA